MAYSLKLLALTALIFLIGFTGIFLPIRNAVHQISNPIQYGLYKSMVSLRNVFRFFADIKEIRNQNLKLIEEKEDLLSQISRLGTIEAENVVLRDQLSLEVSASSKKILLADVIGLPFDNENSELVINKGASNGLRLGSQVIYKNFLVGSVIDVFEKRSTVVLITSPKLSVGVYDQDSRSRAKGITSGTYGTALVMDRILPDEEIKIGDVVLSSGQDGVFDQGFVVGKVVEVIDVKTGPVKKARLETLVDLSRLDKVFVVLD